jgi:hypothetical protein
MSSVPVSQPPLVSHPLVFDEVRIENTNRCGYKCYFCPRELQTRKLGVMPVEDLELALHRIGAHTGIVDLHGFGEPLLDPNLTRKIRIVHETWPTAKPRIYSTLGVNLNPEKLDELAGSGLRYLEVSLYGFDRTAYQEVHGVDRFDLARKNLAYLCGVRSRIPSLEIIMRLFPRHGEVKQPSRGDEISESFHKWLVDIGITVLRERDLHNYGNGRLYNPAGRNQLCSVVWGFRRRVLQVTWDLKVIPCCFDFDASVSFGSLRIQTLAEILRGNPYLSFIEAHRNNLLNDYPVCAGCEKCNRA